MQNNSQIFGLEGEELAAGFLAEKGYQILERNYRFGRYEVDIIARHGDTIVFVEVKSRKNINFGEPEIFVSRRKQAFLFTAANHYLVVNDLELESRFDIVSVWRENKTKQIKHLEGAFYAVAR